jgi:cytochrome c oxidase cbb3-type subunit 3
MSDLHDPADDFDGIKEDDHPLPQWWVLTFIGTIIFSIFYYLYFHTGGTDRSLVSEYKAAKAKYDQLETKANAGSGGGGADLREKYLLALSNPEALKEGAQIYTMRCAACHSAGGEGLIGPNLTDKHWIHGRGEITAIAKVIVEGVPEKGMIPWGNVLNESEIIAVTAFVKSLEGQMKPGKAPEGEQVD